MKGLFLHSFTDSHKLLCSTDKKASLLDHQAGWSTEGLRDRGIERAKGYNVKLYFVERINAKASL